MTLKILFAGAIFSDEALRKHPAVAVSANDWKRGLISALISHGVQVQTIGHLNSRRWPKGRLFPNDLAALDSHYPSTLVPWVNFPLVRSSVLRKSYTNTAQRIIQTGGPPDLVLTYNAYPWHVPMARTLKQKYGIPWVCITLDYDYGENGWPKFLSQAGDADAHVFLSWWAYNTAPVKTPRLHLDGGVSILHGEKKGAARNDTVPTVLYSGKFSDYGGLRLLEDTIRESQGHNLHFALTGKSITGTPERLASRYRNVSYLGFLSQADLHDATLKAAVLLNPRPNDFEQNKGAFPSKLLYYLSYGKPIVSTWTPGLHPSYRPLLTVPGEETGRSFASALLRASKMTPSELSSLQRRMHSFLQENKLWTVQAARLVDWLAQL